MCALWESTQCVAVISTLCYSGSATGTEVSSSLSYPHILWLSLFRLLSVSPYRCAMMSPKRTPSARVGRDRFTAESYTVLGKEAWRTYLMYFTDTHRNTYEWWPLTSEPSVDLLLLRIKRAFVQNILYCYTGPSLQFSVHTSNCQDR